MKQNRKYQLLMILAMLIWGGSWVCAKIISHNMHFQKLVFLRFVITFICFIPFVIIFRENLRINLASLKRITAGSIFYTLYSQMFFMGLTRGNAGMGGILVTSLMPVITFAVMSLSGKTSIRLKSGAGLLLGLAGSMVILKLFSFNTEQLFLSGNIFFLLGAGLWSGVTINSQTAQTGVSIWVYSFYLNGIAALLQLGFTASSGFSGMFPADLSFWIFMIYLTVFSTVFATSLYFYSAKLTGAHSASSFSFIVPSSAVLLSWIFLQEIPEITTIAGGCMTIAAVYIIQSDNENPDKDSVYEQDLKKG